MITFWNCSNSPLKGQCWIYTSFQVEECAKNAPHSKWGDVENTPPSKWRSVRKNACTKSIKHALRSQHKIFRCLREYKLEKESPALNYFVGAGLSVLVSATYDNNSSVFLTWNAGGRRRLEERELEEKYPKF